jgi:transcriptional regulator with XRE-family HTH domain
MIPMDRKRPVDTHIGQRLKEYRQHRGMTVRELADAAHVTPGQISHYEHGRDRISHERVTEFARILRIKSNDLYQPPGSRLRRNHVRLRLMNFMAAVIAEAAALMSSQRKAAADNEATMVAAIAVAVGAAASDADAGERASLAISGNDTAVDTSVGSRSDSLQSILTRL